MQGNHISYVFWYSLENSKKLSQKTDFLAFFQRFFDYALLRNMSYVQIFCQMKIHNRVNCSKSFQKTSHRKKPAQCCLNTLVLGQHCTGKNFVQCCPIVSRKHCTGKNPVQCCLNTFGTTLPFAMLSKSLQKTLHMKKFCSIK